MTLTFEECFGFKPGENKESLNNIEYAAINAKLSGLAESCIGVSQKIEELLNAYEKKTSTKSLDKILHDVAALREYQAAQLRLLATFEEGVKVARDAGYDSIATEIEDYCPTT
jgi:hypothetical protein